MDLTFQLGLLLVIPLPHEVQGQLFQMGDHQLLGHTDCLFLTNHHQIDYPSWMDHC